MPEQETTGKPRLRGINCDTLSVVDVITTHYGPYAFGLISLMCIWFAIVRPELREKTVEWAAVHAILIDIRELKDKNASLNREQQATVEVLRTTAQVLERVAEDLRGSRPQ